MRVTVRTAARGIRWYVREFTGETKWDQYLDRCRTQGTVPMSRRDFERHRADHRERSTQARCC